MSNVHQHHSLFIPPSTQDHRQGTLSATVNLVMYGDYQCSQSADAYRLIKVIKQQLSILFGEEYLCFIFRHFPQVQIHSYAQRAAETAEAAADQNQFWQMHDILLNHQQTLGDGYLVEYANELKLDTCQFLQAMSKHVHLERIKQDIANGEQSGVVTTPALFINGTRYCDLWKIQLLTAAIIAASH
ncbi:MAG: DsbA family protein [Plectolyngbya sp. WJT66-NPBG17]|nr:DsbA family protein [Plectolyngbya sp. WJT66-NPBG17]